jgi:hypothetical protein
MKKIIITLILCTLVLDVFADVKEAYVSQNVFAPQWSDVCTYSAYWTIDTSKDYKKTDKKYWKERRIQFNKEILACEQANTNLEDCYNTILVIEAERTAKWEATYKDERKARLVKGGIATGAVTLLGIFTCLASWW